MAGKGTPDPNRDWLLEPPTRGSELIAYAISLPMDEYRLANPATGNLDGLPIFVSCTTLPGNQFRGRYLLNATSVQPDGVSRYVFTDVVGNLPDSALTRALAKAGKGVLVRLSYSSTMSVVPEKHRALSGQDNALRFNVAVFATPLAPKKATS